MTKSSRGGRRRSLRIVACDDDRKMLLNLVQMLQEAGHRVFAAYDGQSAFELAEYLPDVDLLITNTRLKNMDAPDLIQRVRAKKAWLGILHIGDPLPSDDGPFAGVPTLREPFTPEQLLAAMQLALASSPLDEEAV